MSVSEMLVSNLRSDYPNWKIIVEDEKICFSTTWDGIMLNSEQIEHLKKHGLEIFSIYKNSDYLSIKFISNGGSFS